MHTATLNQRTIKLQQAMLAKQLDAIVLIPSPTLTYMTGLTWHLSERATIACLTHRGWCWLVPQLESAKLEPVAQAGAQLFVYSDEQGPNQAANALVNALGNGPLALGLDPLSMRVHEQQLLRKQYEDISWKNAAPLLGELRIVKDDAEIQTLKRAVALTETVLQQTIDWLEPGQTELAIANKIQQLAFEHQASMSFSPIVASGPNGGNPHALPGERKIQTGDVITFDVGVWVDGYPGDITRNVALGKIDPKLEQIHDLVLAANEAGKRAAGPGVPCELVDRAARNVIDQGGYAEFFIHRTGHGLGLEVHEPPYIVAGNQTPLAPGHVFTVEPGVYLPNLGGVRIEDDCVVTEDGIDTLTTFPRELVRL